MILLLFVSVLYFILLYLFCLKPNPDPSIEDDMET